MTLPWLNGNFALRLVGPGPETCIFKSTCLQFIFLFLVCTSTEQHRSIFAKDIFEWSIAKSWPWRDGWVLAERPLAVRGGEWHIWHSSGFQRVCLKWPKIKLKWNQEDFFHVGADSGEGCFCLPNVNNLAHWLHGPTVTNWGPSALTYWQQPRKWRSRQHRTNGLGDLQRMLPTVHWIQ